MRAFVAGLIVAACSPQPAVRSDDTRAVAGAAHAGAPARSAPAADARAAEVVAVADAPAATVTVPAVAIVDAPLAWSERRARLTLAYRRAHSDPAAADLEIAPRAIVLHYTGGGSATGTRTYFDKVEIEQARRTLARAGAVNVSAHFVVDRDGTIYRLQPETRFARHCIGLNHLAIGIENVGDEKRFPLTDAQVEANAALVRDLASRFAITHLLGHHEVMAFRDHAYYVELDRSYRNAKDDPDTRFMARVRERVADLALAGPGGARR